MRMHSSANAKMMQHRLPGTTPAFPTTTPRHHRRLISASAAAAATSTPETHTYQAETERLMDMIVHSLYSNRDVFLRELVSNASDALDKVRIMALQNPDEYKTGSDLEIRISADKEAHTIVIEDTGVGMTKEDLLSSLGTIARSGTAKFMEQLKEKGDASLIGQFGVGFYSAFLVADKISVLTKNNSDSKAWVWEAAAGSHSYTVSEGDASELKRGTRLTLHLKTDAWEYADANKLGALIHQYSEFISFPIKLLSPKQESIEVVDDEATRKAQEEEDAKAKEEGRDAKQIDPVKKKEMKEVVDWQVQNDNKPLWTRSPKDVTKDEYGQFFKATFKEFLDPLAVSHFNVEGTIEFGAMLFIPGMAPFNDEMAAGKKSRNIRLYVKRVFISDEFDESLLPRYLAFVKGIVDSSDLPLNVSREILQESRVVRAIRKQLIKRTLDMLNEVAGREEKQDYETFWESFGRNIKLGIIEDAANRPALAKLLRFYSSSSKDSMISLDDYISRKKDGQTQIYYLAADSIAAAEASPYAEALEKKGYEVLYLIDPIDEVAAANMTEYDGMILADVSREDLSVDQSDDDKKSLEEASEKFKPLTDYMKKVLGDKVEKVIVSSRLTDSPAIVVASKFGWSSNMERIMKANAMGDQRTAEYMKGKRTLEINPAHPIVVALKDKVEMDSRESSEQVQLLFEAASLTGGFSIDDTKSFAARVYSLMDGGREVVVPEVLE